MEWFCNHVVNCDHDFFLLFLQGRPPLDVKDKILPSKKIKTFRNSFLYQKGIRKREYNPRVLNTKLKEAGIDEVDCAHDFVAFKINSGIFGFEGFIYTKKPEKKFLFGEYLIPGHKLEENWYSFGTPSIIDN